MASGAARRRLARALRRQSDQKQNKAEIYPGLLGTHIGGAEVVNVPGRDGYVYVRLRGDVSEEVQAYNDAVQPIYGLPVKIIRDDLEPGIYRVVGRNIQVYPTWTGQSTGGIKAHHETHERNPTAPGNDIIEVYKSQFLPLALTPSYPTGSMTALIRSDFYIYEETQKWWPGSGTVSFSSLRPTDNRRRFVSVFLDALLGIPHYLTGEFFDPTYTLDFSPHIPMTTDLSRYIPSGAVYLASGTATISQTELFDTRHIAGMTINSGGNVIEDTVWDAKGDLVAGTGLDTAIRLPVGTDGLFLSADSGESAGLKWIVGPAAGADGADGVDGTDAGAGNPSFSVDGRLAVANDVSAYICTSTGTVEAAYIYCRTPGSASSTIVDVHKNGTTIFTTQASRPTLLFSDADKVAKSGTPDVTAFVENDVFSIDIDQIATGAEDLTVVLVIRPAITVTPSPADIYVSSAGDDSNSGLTTALPKLTLQAAVDLVPATYDRDVTIHVSSGDLLVGTVTGIKFKRPLYPNHRLLIRGYMNPTPDQFTAVPIFSGTLSGTATNGWPDTTTRATDSSKNFGAADALRWHLFHITGGTGFHANDEFNWYQINASGTTTIDIPGIWNSSTPTSSTTYEIFDPTDCQLYGNAAYGTQGMLRLSGCQNVVMRFMTIRGGSLAGGLGSGHLMFTFSVDTTILDDAPYGTNAPELAWLGLYFVAPANSCRAIYANSTRLALWACGFNGLTATGTMGLSTYHSRFALLQVLFDNWLDTPIYIVSSDMSIKSGYIRSGNEASGFRGCILVDVLSKLGECQYVKIADGYWGILLMAQSLVYFQAPALITSCGHNGIESTQNSYAEIAVTTVSLTNNGGWGVEATRGGIGQVSLGVYSGNALGTYGASTDGQVY